MLCRCYRRISQFIYYKLTIFSWNIQYQSPIPDKTRLSTSQTRGFVIPVQVGEHDPLSVIVILTEIIELLV